MNPNKHHRRSIRLPGYDYASEGWYFITICVQNKKCKLGEIEKNNMILNQIGRIIDYHWKRLPIHFNNIELDQYQIMPNHFHGIIYIGVGAKHSEEKDAIKCKRVYVNASPLQMPCGTNSGSLGAIIQNFKSVTSRKINKINKSPGSHFWQRNYYGHIIRNEKDLNRIRKYILENPLKWDKDKNDLKNPYIY
jgi:REP element-mobilizing transposase RayT